MRNIRILLTPSFLRTRLFFIIASIFIISSLTVTAFMQSQEQKAQQPVAEQANKIIPKQDVEVKPDSAKAATIEPSDAPAPGSTAILAPTVTTLISPTGDGGFENGATMAANGWTAVNASTDAWVVGTAPTASAGTKAGYISTDGGTTWAYSQLSTIEHLYRDVTIPAGESKLTLTFKWKATGEGTTTSDFDNMKVFFAPTSVTPVQGTAISSSFQISGPGATSGMYKLSSASYNSETITFAGTPGTTYRLIFSWKSDSSTIGNPPAAIDEVSLTSNPANSISSNAVTGNWSATTSWSGGVVPTAGDNVTIVNGATITIDTASNPTVNNLTVGGGTSGVLVYNTTAAQTLTVLGDLTVSAGATLQTGASGTVTTSILDVSGNIANSGIIDLSTNTNTAGATLRFSGSGNSTYSGTGATNDLFILLPNKSTISQVIDLSLSNFTVRGSSSAAAGALLTTAVGTGTLKFSGTNTFSGVLWSASGYSIPSTMGFWLNNSNFTVTAQGGSPSNAGLLRISAGTYNIGTGTGNSMGFNSGSAITVEGGTINASSRFGVATSTNTIAYTQSGGTINVNSVGNTSTTLASFDLGTSTTSTINITAGTVNVILANTGGSGPRDVRGTSATSPTITGGTINLGTAASGTAKTFVVQGSIPSLVVTNTSAGHTGSLNASTSVFGDVTINSTATLNLNGFTLTERTSTFTNNGTLTGTTASSRLSFFSPTNTAQTFAGSGTVTSPLDGMSVQNTGGVTITHTNTIPTLRVNLFAGTITNSNKITLGTGAALAVIVQIGAAGLTTAGGSFDVAPTFNLGTGTYGVLYLQESVARTTGLEIPATRTLTTATISNPNNVTVAGGALGIGTLTLQAGNLITTNSNLVTITGTTTTSTARSTYTSAAGATSTGTTVTVGSTTNLVVGMNVTVTAGTGAFAASTTVTSIPTSTTFVVSATPTVALSGGASVVSGIGGWVNGPLALTLPASLVSGSTYAFPIGKGTYNSYELVNPTTTSGGTVVVKSEVFDANSGGTPGVNMSALNTNRYWAASITSGGANFTNTLIKLTDSSVVSTSAIAASATQTGSYDLVGGTSPTIVAGTSITSTAPAATTIPGFYAIGTKAVPMAYTSSTTTQAVTSNIFTNTTNNQIVGIQIVTTGNASPLSATSFTLNTTGTTAPATDITNAKLWYTGTSSTFATTSQFGSTNATPSGSYSITGSQVLAEGTNYFWLTYDIPTGATVNNVVDAECTSLTVGSAFTPTVTAPAGTRTIKAQLNGTYTIGASQVSPNYTKLTDAIADLNTLGVSGPVMFQLAADYTSATETFPLTINTFIGASSSNTLTIKPASGVTASISGSNASELLVMNAADWVIIDGSNSGGTSRDLTITNTNAGTSSAVVWMQSSGADGATNNIIKNLNVVGSGNTQTLFGIGSGSSTISTSSLGTGNNTNTIQNNNISKTQYGIFSQGASAGSKNTGNIITQNLVNTVSPNNVRRAGVLVGFENSIQITRNTISEIASATSTEDVFGISLGTTAISTSTFTGNEVTNATISRNIIGTVRQTATYSACGIFVAPATSGTNQISNNALTGVSANGTSGDFTVGILVGGGAGSSTQVYFNSVSLNGTQTGGSDKSYALAIGGSNPTVDIRDNILYNTQNNGTGNNYGLALGYSTFTALTLSNNDYFVSADATHFIGATASLSSPTNVSALPIVAGMDTGSLTSNPNFNDPLSNLQPQTGSPVIDAGVSLSTTVSPYVDITGAVRVDPPSMGAYESASDTAGPTITYTPLGNTTSTANRTLAITVTDPSGVPTSGTGLPRLYFRKGTSDPYVTTQCSFVSGSSYTCTIDYSLVTGGSVSPGNTIQYYVAAQDNLNNVSVNPSAGASGLTANPPAASTPPTSPNSYLISISYSGSYNVGTGEAFTSLTNTGGVFASLNAGVLTGNVTINITSDLTGETGTVALNQWAEEGVGGYTLTIKPSGAARTITGTGTNGTVIKLNGADRVTLDGSTSGGTDRSLTISNPNTATGTATLFIGSIGTGAGATNDTIKNCIIKAGALGSSTVTTFGIFVGDTTGAAAGADNDNLTIQNNQIMKATYGIQANGVAATGVDDNLLIDGNLIGDSVAANFIGRYGMLLSQATGAIVRNNTITNVVTSDSAISSTNNATGIVLSTGFVNSSVTGNNITGVRYTNTAGYGGKGIDINTGSTTSSLTIANNFVSDIKGDGWSDVTTDGICGIRILGTTGGVNLYDNSVNLGSGSFAGNSSGTQSAAMVVGSSATALDIRGNIFASNLDNTGATGDKTYAIYSAAANTAFTDINYNDYYASGVAGVLGFLTSDRTTIAAWRTATGKDLQSIAGDPLFTSATDLHINPATAGTSPVRNVGAPITGITTDYDGETRSATTPDIGADEFSVSFSSSGNANLSGNYDSVTINSPDVVTLNGNLQITQFIIVKNGATLQLGSNIISGTATFLLEAGGTLGVGDPLGVTTSGATGNIRVTGTRTYTVGGNYIYNGSVAQVTGNALSNAPNNLTLNNPAGVMSSVTGLTVTGTLEVVQGTFTSASTYKDVLIDNTGTLAASSGETINVGGNWTNNGTFVHNGGDVNFNGAATQTISGASVTTFFNLSLSGTTLNMAADTSVIGTLQVNSGRDLRNLSGTAKTLTMSGGAATIYVNGGDINGTNVGPGNDINLNITGASTGIQSGVGVSLVKFLNVTVGPTSVLTLKRLVDVQFGAWTINGALQIYSGGAVGTTAPTYNPGSLLIYNTGSTYGRGLEWSATVGAGFPNDVQLSGNTLLDLGNGGAGTARAMAGSLVIDAGSTLSMNNGGNQMTQPLTVGKNVNITGTLTLSTSIGGDIKVGGNWTDSGTFTPNNRAVIFNGAGNTQVITRTGGETFAYLVVNKSSGNIQPANLSSTITVNATVGDVLQLLGGGIDLNDGTMTLSGNGGNLLVSGGSRTITTATNAGFNFNGSKTVTSTGGGTLVFGTNVFVTPNSPGISVDFGANLTTINGTLLINGGQIVNNGPTYGTGATLRYNTGGTYNRGAEWSATSGAGYPYHVSVTSGTTLNVSNGTPTTARQMAGDLSIESGSTVNIDPMSATLTVIGSVLNTGTLTLSTALGGDLVVGGNFSKAALATFTPNSRAVFFNGTGTQTISAPPNGSVAFDYVVLNKTGGSVQLLHDASVAAPGGGSSLQFNGGAGDILDLGGKTFTVNSGTIGGSNSAGAFSGSSTSNMVLNGTGAVGTVKFTTSNETLNSLTMNRTSNGSVTLGTQLLISGGTNALALTAGIVNTGANTLTMGGNATSNGSSSSYVVGKMKKLYDTTPKNFTFDVGTTGGPTDGYTPAAVNAQTGTGDVTASVTNAHHPTLTGISLQRYWSLTNNGITLANLSFNYLDGDLPASPPEASLVTFKIDGQTTTTPVGSAVNPATNQITMTGATTFSDWTAGAINAPTAVKMVSFNATAEEGGVLVRWQTGREVSNLGFNLSREDGRGRTRVTPSLVAGSALMAGPQTTLTAGQSYSWFDPQGRPDSRYYLEDIDLNGKRNTYGPVVPLAGKIGSNSLDSQSALLSELRPQDGATTTSTQRSYPARQEKAQRNAARLTVDSETLAQQRALAAGQAVKLQVRQSGWYKVSQSELIAAGLDPNASRNVLQLYADGVEQSLLIRGDSDRPLAAGEFVEFYGTGINTPGSDTRTYWLVAGTDQGKRINERAIGPVIPLNISIPNFAYTVERRDRMIYFPSLHNGEAENFFGPVINTTAVTQTLDVRKLDTTAAATLEVALQGASVQSHQVHVRINGTDLGVISFNAQEHPVTSLNVPATALVEGQNNITLIAEGGDEDVSVVDTVSLTYAHLYAADNDRLTFTTPAGRGTRLVGFTSPQVSVFDITDPNNVQALGAPTEPDNTGYAVLVPSGQKPRTLVALTDNQAQAVDGVTANQPSNWTADNQPGADFVIITHGDFKNAVEPLAQLRRNQGLQVAVVDVEDIYDEFSYGAHNAGAVKEFLAWTATHWQLAPRYVLLVGDASIDPRNYLGYGKLDYVPTRMVDTSFLETASDDSLADFNSDGLAEMAVGRLPVRTVQQAETVVGKIINYVPGVSAQGALLISDHNDGYDFEGVNQQVQSSLPAGMPVTVINRGNNPPDQVHGQIISGINQGPQVVNFVGHGSVEVWTGASLFSSADANALTNGNRLPLFISMTCLNGYFADLYTESLAEAMMKAPQGGAVAAWASSGLTPPGAQSAMDQQLMQLLFSNADSPMLGDAVRTAKTATDDKDVRRTWILFGDPTMRLR